MSETVQEPQEPQEPQEAPAETDVPAEPENPDAEPSEPIEPDEPAEPPVEPPAAPEGMSPESIEKLQKKLDTSAATWRRRVSELLGEDALLLVACELCESNIPGYHWPAEIKQPENDVQARLLDVLKTPAAPEYLHAGDVRMCPECQGWGVTLTGSKKAGKERKDCVACKGYGYVPPPGQPANGAATVEQVRELVTPDGQPLVADDADVWGSPKLLPDGRENPNYGKMPQYKHPDFP
jgi:hypothetical protein